MDEKKFNFQEAKQMLSLIDSKKDFSKQEIEQIQSYLKSAGYDLGNTGKNKDGVDGDWGNKTTTAINQLRSDFNTKYSKDNSKDNSNQSTKTYNHTAESFVPMESIGAYNVGQIMGNAFKRNKPEETNPYKGMSAEELITKHPKVMQQLLIGEDYDLGKWKDDGKWGDTSKKAWEQAQKDGWVLQDGKLIKPKPTFSQMIESGQNEIQEFNRKTTPRQYTAAQNTIGDVIGASIRRGVAKIAGEDFVNKYLPSREFNENQISNELHDWLQDAIDKKWSPEERKKYFESNPDGEYKVHWIGDLNGGENGKRAKESDYQKYYNVSYEGPMTYGIKNTMFGDGIYQAQGSLGGFDIVYTKDGAYIRDSWTFDEGENFDTSTLKGLLRHYGGKWGSHYNSGISPTRQLNAFIKYRV